MSPALRELAASWLAQGRRALIVEVVDFQGSVPRETGTRMLVTADAVHGTIGGGHLEWRAIDTARRHLAQGLAGLPQRERIALGPALGQCCGGTVTLAWRALDAQALSAWPETAPRFHLQLYGAGHVGRAIAYLLSGLDVAVDWIDEREAEFPADLLPGRAWPARIRKASVDAVEAEVAQAEPGAFYLVLTHSHELDLRLAEAILRRGDFAWFGLIGSASKRARFEHRLRERGVGEHALARMVCPIGVPGVNGKEPEVIAVAVVAQMLQASASVRAAGGAQG